MKFCNFLLGILDNTNLVICEFITYLLYTVQYLTRKYIHATPRHATPRHVTSRHVTSRHVMLCIAVASSSRNACFSFHHLHFGIRQLICHMRKLKLTNINVFFFQNKYSSDRVKFKEERGD